MAASSSSFKNINRNRSSLHSGLGLAKNRRRSQKRGQKMLSWERRGRPLAVEFYFRLSGPFLIFGHAWFRSIEQNVADWDESAGIFKMKFWELSKRSEEGGGRRDKLSPLSLLLLLSPQEEKGGEEEECFPPRLVSSEV